MSEIEGLLLPSLDGLGRTRVSSEPRKDGDSVVVASHNWCDRTTWYGQSVPVLAETLSDSGDGLTFTSEHPNWIDLSHGKLYREDIISAPYLPVIKVDGVVQTERAPFAVSGGDYHIDYALGQVIFASAQTGIVTADYSYENGSMFVVSPSAGKVLWVEKSEVQFSLDVELLANIHFQAWAYNPQDLPNKAPASSRTTYKVARDYVDEAQGVYPQVPAFGGTSRGLQIGHLVFPFNYLQLKELQSSYGLEIRVWVEGDVKFGGTFATATFYCSSYTEES